MWKIRFGFYCFFFQFFGSDFFLKCFPNLFIVHSRTYFFVRIKLIFLASGFLFSLAAFRHWFSGFLSNFFRNGFHNSFIARSRSIFFIVLVNENFLDHTSDLVLLCFLTSPTRFLVSAYPDFLELTFSMILVTSIALQLNFLLVTSFIFLGQVRDLPHYKRTSEITYATLNFMNVYKIKINSVHLNSAKLICTKSWVKESLVLISNISFEKSFIRAFSLYSKCVS